jgi:hypothetical protein
VSFYVGATGTPPLSFQWRRNGTALSDGGPIMGAKTFSLTIDPVDGSSAGLYDCVVSNLAGTVLTKPFVLNGPLPVTIVSPGISCTNLVFSFATVNSQSYTVQQTTNLATANWQYYTNIIGDGSPTAIAIPISRGQRFFRVAEP